MGEGEAEEKTWLWVMDGHGSPNDGSIIARHYSAWTWMYGIDDGYDMDFRYTNIAWYSRYLVPKKCRGFCV